MENEYHKQADDFLKKFGITMEWVCLGECCPKFCKDAGNGVGNTFPRKNHIHGKQHAITFKRLDEKFRTKQFQIMYWNSYADEQALAFLSNPYSASFLDKNARSQFLVESNLSQLKRSFKEMALEIKKNKIKAYDVLTCLTKYEPGSFKSFCGDFGYGTDSISARDTWQAICEEWEKVSSFFTREELEELQEIN